MIQWLIKLQAVIHGAIFNRGDSRGGRRRAITDQKRVVLGRQLANKDRIRQAQKDKALREASTKRAQRNMRKRAVKRLAWTIAGLVVVIIIGSNSLIRDVEIAESTPDFLSEDITRHAAEYFDTFSHRITWTFDSDAYANALMQEVTTIAEVKAIVPWFSTTLQVEASDRRESLGWIDQRRDSYFLVDSGGVAYKKVAELPSGIAVVTDVSGIRVDEGTTVVSASSLNSIRELF